MTHLTGLVELAGMLGLLIGLCAILGLVVGSFLNVVIYRVPRNESIVTSSLLMPGMRHADPGEGQRPGGLVACAPWSLSRCQAPISVRYPLVELACGALFAGTAARFGHRWDLPAYLALFAGLLALSCIDVERMLLPKKIVYPLTVLVAALLLLAAAETGKWHDYVIGVICAAGWFVVFFALNFASPTAPGFRGRAAVPGAGPLAGVAGHRLRPAWASSPRTSSARWSVSL